MSCIYNVSNRWNNTALYTTDKRLLCVSLIACHIILFLPQPRMTSAPATPFHSSSAFAGPSLRALECAHLRALDAAGWTSKEMGANVFLTDGIGERDLRNGVFPSNHNHDRWEKNGNRLVINII